MSLRLHLGFLLVGCASPAPDDAGLCAVEASLSAEQDALGLNPPSVCADLVDRGDTTLVAAGVVPQNVDFGAILSPAAMPHRAELEGTRRLFSYEGITLSVPTGATGDLELAVLTAQAWATWKSSAPASFGVVADMAELPDEPTLACCGWRNRYDHFVVSLDATPLEIGASVSLVGEPTAQGAEQVYGNTGLISIDRQTALGGEPSQGSRPIYGAADDRENQLRYFADGAVFTLAHEASHLYIDQRNSVSEVANRIWDGRNFVNASYVSAEEVVANWTACEALSGAMSDEMVAFNQEVTTRLRGYAGVEERLTDLRAYAAAGSERLVLAAGPECGG